MRAALSDMGRALAGAGLTGSFIKRGMRPLPPRVSGSYCAMACDKLIYPASDER
jgi:hypothetical protein